MEEQDKEEEQKREEEEQEREREWGCGCKTESLLSGQSKPRDREPEGRATAAAASAAAPPAADGCDDDGDAYADDAVVVKNSEVGLLLHYFSFSDHHRVHWLDATSHFDNDRHGTHDDEIDYDDKVWYELTLNFRCLCALLLLLTLLDLERDTIENNVCYL